MTDRSEPHIVASGGSVVGTIWPGGNCECPFVVRIGRQFILFRNQIYGPNALNTQYGSPAPLDSAPGTGNCITGQLPAAAPEIIRTGRKHYIVALKPGLDGMCAAQLKFVRTGTDG